MTMPTLTKKNVVRWMAVAVTAVAIALLTLPLDDHAFLVTDELEAAGSCAANAKKAPLDYTIKDMNGVDVKLASFKGKVIVLNFWATWCGPCKAEIPALVELQKQYANDLVVLGMSVDDPVEKLKPFAAQYKINYPILVGLGREDVQDAYGPLYGIPMTFFISRDGKICKTQPGIDAKANIEKHIKALL
jgi:thiol-disulfide isomerase/thioredoxin